MTIIQSIILGIVQGLTEMLPVSSSAHLYAIPKLLGWGEIGDFDVALHFGTLIAIIIFFWKDWMRLIAGGYQKVVKKKDSFEGRMFWYLVCATIPGGIIGFLLDHFFGELLTNATVIGIAMIVMGIIFYIADKKGRNEVDYEKMNFKQTFLIGLSQALAFIPGVSRSGITITTARAMGIKRESAAKYSFLLSAPIVLGATAYTFYKALKVGTMAFDTAFWAGVFVSFLVGLLVVKVLFEYLKKGDFKIFAIWRILLGIIILICLV